MRPVRLAAALSLMVLATIGWGGHARAQFDPRQTLASVIMQLQVGQPNPTWFGAQVWQTIAMQTGNSGIYPVLAQGGAVTNVQLTQQQPLPNGMMFQMTSTQQNGLQLGWAMGISNMTNRIEFLNFGPLNNAPTLPTTGPTPPVAPRPAPPNGTPTPQTTSEACQRFPNLC